MVAMVAMGGVERVTPTVMHPAFPMPLRCVLLQAWQCTKVATTQPGLTPWPPSPSTGVVTFPGWGGQGRAERVPGDEHRVLYDCRRINGRGFRVPRA